MMKKIIIVFCVILSGCAILADPMIKGRNKGDILFSAGEGCNRIYKQDACFKVFTCLGLSTDILFTDKQISEYNVDVDYSKLNYKDKKYDLAMYYLWHPDEIVYNKNTAKRQADNRKKMYNFQIIQNTISKCYAENGLDVNKVLNSYKPQN